MIREIIDADSKEQKLFQADDKDRIERAFIMGLIFLIENFDGFIDLISFHMYCVIHLPV
jgi:hypothetical protein